MWYHTTVMFDSDIHAYKWLMKQIIFEHIVCISIIRIQQGWESKFYQSIGFSQSLFNLLSQWGY